MMSINKKTVLLFSLISISFLNKAQTLSIPHEAIQQDVSLFVLAQDFEGNHKIGIFDFDTTETVKKITAADLQDAHDLHNATFSLEGEEVAIFDSRVECPAEQNIIYFEVVADVTVVKALIISNNFLSDTFIKIVEMPVELPDDFDEFNFADDIFGVDFENENSAAESNTPVDEKSFSPAELYAILKIAILLQVDKTKRLFSKVKDFAFAWGLGYKAK